MKVKFFGVLGALLLAASTARADVVPVGQSYDPRTGDFTIYVKATEPWVVWMTTDFYQWVQVSKIQGAGKSSWTDYGAGMERTMGFYTATPKSHPPRRGWRWHFGWVNHHAVVD